MDTERRAYAVGLRLAAPRAVGVQFAARHGATPDQLQLRRP